MPHPGRRARLTLSALVLILLTLPLAACDVPLVGDDGPPEPVVDILDLQGNTTQIVLDQGFVDALSSLGLTPGTSGRARLSRGKLVLPITGGNVTVFEPGEVSPYVVGQLQHEGSGLTLTGAGATVEISNLNIDPGASRVYGDVTVDGRVEVTSGFLFQLDGRSLEPLETTDRTAVLQGTQVEVSGEAAQALDAAFDTDEVASGLLVGTAKITLKLPRSAR